VKKTIQIDTNSSKPKYRQLIDSVIKGIERKGFVKGDKMPSISKLSSDFGLSRDTVMLAFNELKSMGIVKSQPGKGYYITSTDVQFEENIFVLFDEFNSFKEDLYNSFVKSFKGKVNVDIYFHNNNLKILKKLILENAGNYTSYVIMPSMFENIGHLLSKLPSGKVYILDRFKPEFKNYPVVYQDFEQDFYDALVEGILLLKNYRKLVFVNPEGKEYEQRATGFSRFCEENNFKFEIIKSLTGVRPEKRDAYFVALDRDLVEIVKIAKENKYKLGKKFGIVSFNDTMLKEVAAGGITTVSTDFAEMGKILAKMIIEKKCEQIRNPSRLIIRNSL